MNELVQLICIVSMDEHLSFGMMKLHLTGFVPYLFHFRTYTFYRNLHRSHNLLKSGISMYICKNTRLNVANDFIIYSYCIQAMY